MFKITNIDSLGTEYTVTDQKGNILRKIQVIPHTEILEAAAGKYNPDLGSVKDYLAKSIAVLSGVDQIDPYSVLWHADTDDEVILSDIIEYAIKHGYQKIVLEHLVDTEE
jgi:hypothetical protein